MSTLKLSGLNSGSSIIKAPDSGSTGVTFTLPASAGTLVTSADVTNKLPLAGGTMTGDLDISDTGAGALTVGGTTNAYSAPVLFTVSDIGLDVTDGTKHLASWASHGGSSHTGSAIGTRSNHDLALITNDTKRVVINTAGVVSIPQGIELGSGIDATAANTLDDYEEGNWTPTLTGSGTISHRVGKYVKIGNQIMVQGEIRSTSYNNSGSTDVKIGGLPYSALNESNYNFAANVTPISGFNSPANQGLVGYVSPNQTDINLFGVTYSAGANYDFLQTGEMGTTVEIFFALHYRTN